MYFFTTKTGVKLLLYGLIIQLITISSTGFGQNVFTAGDILKTQKVKVAKISPDGKQIAYTLDFLRSASEKPGKNYRTLCTIFVETGAKTVIVTGKEGLINFEWSPDGKQIAFIAKRENNATEQVWVVASTGGTPEQVSNSETKIYELQWQPSGKNIAYNAKTPKTALEKALEEKGFAFKFYEENLKHRNLYLVDLKTKETGQLTEGVTVWDFVFSPDGKTIAASVSPKNLIDHKYAFRKIHLLNLESKKLTQLSNNPGKLGNYAFSPDGKKLAYSASLTQSDNAVSQAYVIPVGGGELTNVTEKNFRGHITWVDWQNDKTVVYKANEGVNTTLSSVVLTGNGIKRDILLNSAEIGFVFDNPSYTSNFKHFALVGDSPAHPPEAFYWQPGKNPKRMSDSNSWLKDEKLGEQKPFQYKARDGVEIEGLLVYPVNYKEGEKYPLVAIVHGGPESNFRNGWLTQYSRPAQALAGRDYVVFYPNYRSSTGYGVEFAATGFGDAAGVEFDDIADGIEFLIKEGIVDEDRVGLGGGSYGGFASAWFATYYTKYVKAVCMFVGISDLISKRGTTDIPYEELYVHSGEKLEEMWEISLKRSPIYYAHQSKTAVLIYGGLADTRVHPSQSLEFYRRLKMNDHPAVRLVRYPGEKHGNAKQPGQIDVAYRILDWYDWYVKDAKPFDGAMPPLDISVKYGLELPE